MGTPRWSKLRGFFLQLFNIIFFFKFLYRLEVELLKTPTTTCTWFKSGNPIEHSDKFQIWHGDASKDPVQSVLIIMNLTLDDAAEYTFRASNDLGECATSATVIVQRKFTSDG